MFGRQAGLLRRVSVNPRSSRLLLQHHAHNATPRVAIVVTSRTYATPGRPRKAVGEPSRTVKRAVKREAIKSASGVSAAEQKLKAKAKKATTKKPAKKAKIPKKELTDEQKTAKAERQEKAVVKELKQAALDPPKNFNLQAYHVFISEKSKGSTDGENFKAMSRDDRLARMGSIWKDLYESWRNVSSADKEHYNHLARTGNEARQAEYKRWVESHTPDEINNANSARRKLRTKFPVGKGRHTKWPAISDERAVPRPINAYSQFMINRLASGDFKNIPLAETSKLVSKEWRELNQSEKEKYVQMRAQDSDRYVSEYNSVYGHAPPVVAQQAAAAA